MNVIVNDEPRDLPDGATCRDLVAQVTGRDIGDDGRTADGRPLGLALALDGEVVARGSWARTALHDGARAEIVTAVQGG